MIPGFSKIITDYTSYRHRIVHGTRVALAFLLTFLIIRLFTIP
ncbi:hypothetical protein ACUOA5_41665, partial [Escherichia coli]